MAEHGRVRDYAGGVYQWVDDELVMLLDIVTSEPQRFGPGMNSIGKLEDALAVARKSPQGPPRYIIVKLTCIAPYKVAATLQEGNSL